MYIHDETIRYPDQDFHHMVLRKKKYDYVYDDKFPYRLKAPKYKIIRFLLKIAMLLLVQPLCYIRYCLKIKGKENYKLYRKMTGRKAMITICNHTTEWDTLFVMTSRYFSFPEFPIWQEGAESESGMLYREVGGLVMPIHSMRGTYYAYKAMEDVLKEEKWLHVFPEAACWTFYPAIRPFKPGTFRLAYEAKLPILPTAVVYRKPKGLYRLFKKHPNAQLNIGEPITADYDLPKKEAVRDLEERAHLAMVRLVGLQDEAENRAVIERLPTYHVESDEPAPVHS